MPFPKAFCLESTAKDFFASLNINTTAENGTQEMSFKQHVQLSVFCRFLGELRKRYTNKGLT